MFRFLPKEDDYFLLLRDLAKGVREATEKLPIFFLKHEERAHYAEDIKAIEHRCDDILNSIVTKLNSSFITPLDREDIYALANEMDTIADRVNGVARRSLMYHLEEATSYSIKMSELLVRAAVEIESAILLVANDKGVGPNCSEIKRLEEEGDNLYSSGISELFSQEHDPLFVIKWHSLYETLEDSIDHCKTVAGLLESIVLKHS
jgi:predicted phosphate transport protein (TIGR00153 family)